MSQIRRKYYQKIITKYIFVFGILVSSSFNLLCQNGLFLNSNVAVKLSTNVIVSVNTDLIISPGATLVQQNNGILSLAGDFVNNGTFTTNATLLMNGSTNQELSGTSSTVFNILSINKTSGQVELNFPTRINNSLRLISNSIFDLNSNDLTIAPDAKVCSNDGTDDSYDSFSETKCLVNSGSSTDPLAGAYLIKEISPSATSPFELQFPISTPGTFSSLKVRFLSGGALFGTNPVVKVKAVPLEHPEVESPNVSLNKYWVIKTNDVTINNQGADIYGIYDEDDVEGNEGSYAPLLFAPNYNLPNGYWRIKPGVTNYVNINFKVWYSQKVNFIDGDWTLGEQSAGQATYYARSDGDYNNVNTWSKTYFDGPVSNTIPNRRSDRIRIQNHTVTISNTIADANIISLETGTEGRSSGILKISSNNICKGDTFRIQPNARIFIANSDGISNQTGTAGAIQTNIRDFSSNGIYCYWEGQNQITGLGLPDNIKTIIIDKLIGSKAYLSKNSTISDSLIIVEGIFDLNANSINGYSANKKMQMLGGELIVRSYFPTNYTPPVFNYGQITFDGTGNTVIPSSGSIPGIIQYNKLNIKGNRSGNVTLESSGEIKLISDLDVSSLIFTNNTYSFMTSGSTVRFAKNGGNQNICFTPLSPIDNAVNLKFYNLIVDSAGTKTIIASNPGIFTVVNDIKINNTASLIQNNYNIEVQGNWINLSGTFSPSSNYYVKMLSPTATVSKTIISRDTTDNPFQDLIIQGPGIVEPADNLKVLGKITITSNANFKVDGKNLFLFGNWTNQGGTFIHTSSTAYFEGSATQFISKNSGNETFNNLVLRNGGNLNSNNIGINSNSGLIITNNLDLTFGRIDARDRFVEVDGNITRSGGGYINSRLRQNMQNGTTERTFVVGYQNSFTPITIKFYGTGGTAGLFQVLADTITTNTTIIKWADGVPTALSPPGSKLSPSKHIARQWTLEIPQGSTFAIGSLRQYQATPNFVGKSSPNGDLRNGTNSTLLDVNLYNSTNWIYPLYYGLTPYISNRYTDSITYKDLHEFGNLVVGEPSTLTFYSRGDGLWNDRSNWSLVYYDGIVSNEYPGETTTNFIAYIGANHQIFLNSDQIVNNNGTLEGYVAVDSSGVLDLGASVLSGTGEFRMFKNSTIKIKDPEGITATTQLGNIRTSTRNYNYLSNNSGTFIYNRNGAQNSGNGLPSGIDSVNVIIADNQNSLTFNTNGTVNIRDSLYIKSGNLISGNNNITLAGNFRIEPSAVFTHSNRTFSFTGKRLTQYVSAPAANLTFYNLNMSKTRDSSFVQFIPTASGNSYNIQIINNLNFESTNKGYINLSNSYNGLGFPDYNSGEWYITMVTPATVTRNGIGHIDGELRKYVPAGALTNEGILFELGGGIFYRPFLLDLNGSGGTAGYIGVQSIHNLHPYSNELDDPFYSLTPERMIQNYWRITRPVSSPTTFTQGARTMDLSVFYANPEDIPPSALVYCFDLTFWKGGATTNWQRLSPPNSAFNNGSGSTCGDRNINANEASYSPNATLTSTEAYTIASSRPLANQNLGLFNNNRYLLADVVIGQQGPGLTQFYSAKSGDWTDPSTWYTGNYNSGVNANGGYPRERLHVANIGEGRTVRLNANLGNSWPDNGVEFLEQRLGSVIVEETSGGRGHLDLGTFVIRTSVFQLKSGGIIESSCADGFHIANNRGNIIQQYNGSAIARDFNLGNHNNGNYIFTPRGINSTTYLNPDYRYCQPTFSTSAGRIDSVLAANGATFNYNNVFTKFGDNQNSTNGHRYFPYDVFWLEAGKTYTFRLKLGGVTTPTSYKGHLFFDQNFDGNFTSENVSDGGAFSTSYYKDISFTVPSNTPQGTTEMRMIATNQSSYTNPCQTSTSYYGEAEDYTVYIKNPSYTITQNTGGAIPPQIASITVNADSSGNYVEQNSNLSVKDSILLKAGQFSTSTYTMKLQGDLINNTGINALASNIGGIEFNGLSDQRIRGNFNTKIYNITLNNTGKSIILNKDLTVRNLLSFTKDCKLDVENANLILDSTSLQIASVGGNFSANRMITSLGTLASNSVTKIFPSTYGIVNPKSFYFPIGYSTNFNPVSMYDTLSSYVLNPTFNVKIIGQKHPTLVGNNSLNIYWKVNSTNFANLDSMKLWYQISNVVGDSLKYIPAIYINSKWNIDVGDQPWAKSSPIKITNTPRINGDWTAGAPKEFADGMIYYSRNTGVWSNPKNWSTDEILKHNGEPTSYYPGFLFTSDTLNIDGHNITFDIDSVCVDSIRIGGTNAIPATGKLIFANNLSGKKLTVKSIFLDNDNGSIELQTGIINDTLEIKRDLINNSQVGVYLGDASDVHALNLNFIGDSVSNISGSGKWYNVKDVYLNKLRGLLDTLKINSGNFSLSSQTSNPRFFFNSGVLISNSGLSTLIANNNHTVELFPFSGLIAQNGDFQTKSSMLSNANSVIKINGSNIYVGDGPDENYSYYTGTDFQLLKGKFVVAGAFLRKNLSSVINLNLTNLTELFVAKYGYTGAEPSFDLRNNGSSLSMSGGRIVVVNGNQNSSADITINSELGTGITGGVIQIGDTNLTTSLNNFKISGISPVFDLHLVGNVNPDIFTTSITSAYYIVKNNILIDLKQKFDINGNTLELKGNLLNYGELLATPSSATALPWQIVLTGNDDQYFKNFNLTKNYFEIYNLSLDKLSGRLVLGDATSNNSTIKINEFLDFSLKNNSFIDAKTYSNKVIIGPNNYLLGQYEVNRSNLGHVFGTMSRYAANNSPTLGFAVGADTISSYRPVVIELSGSANTPGYIDVTPNNILHPDIANSELSPVKSIPRYWTVIPNSVQPFGLGINGKYNITTYFLNPGDVPSGANANLFEHNLRIPPYPSLGSWFNPIFASNSIISVQSKNLIQWGDFIVGEPVTTSFFSINNGNWQDINSWSLSGYNIPNPPTRIPNQNTDIVRIGNGKTITLIDDGLNPLVRTVLIEKYNGNPGTLQVDGQFNYFSGSIFTLEDGCTLAMQNIDGIRPSSEGAIGAVQTNFRDFKIGRYIYNSKNGSQVTGTALPNYVQSLIIDNSSTTTNKKVFLSNYPGATTINVVDSLFIRQGVFNGGNRNLRLLGNLVLDSIVNDGAFEPLNGKLTFDSSNFHNIIMKNRKGLTAFDIDLKIGDALVTREGIKVTSSTNLTIQNNLNFGIGNMLILGDSTNLIVSNSSTTAITNYSKDQFIRTSHTSGLLIRSLSPTGLPKDYIYPVGSYEYGTENYTPLILNVQSGTNTGKLGVRASPGDKGGFPGGHIYLRNSIKARYLKRFWMIDSVAGDFTGLGRFYYQQTDVYGNEIEYNRIGRWRPNNERYPGQWDVWDNPVIDTVQNYFETITDFSSSEFTGDWTLGNPFAFMRIFYSRQTGLWNDPNSWTENDTHSGPIFGPTDWPDGNTDSVVVGGGNGIIPAHEITMTTNAIVRGTTLGTGTINRGILNTANYKVLGQYFTMGDESHLKITSPEGISQLGFPTGSIQSSKVRFYNPNGIFEYNGSISQIIGDGLPGTVNSLIINNSGIEPNNNVLIDRNIGINKDLTITRGTLDLQTYTTNNSTSSGTFLLSTLGRLKIGGDNNLLTSINNYSIYNINDDSYVEFTGDMGNIQTINLLPINAVNGIGNLDLTYSGTKIVNGSLLVRGNLRNFNPARLEVKRIEALQIKRNVINESAIYNYGIIEIGN